MFKDFNLERAQKAALQLIETTSFEDQMWIFRNITYDQVKYFSEQDKGIIYDGTYSPLNREQANNLQRQISTCTDLFTQSVSKHREFNQDYLRDYEFAAPYLHSINNLKDTIEELKEEIAYLRSEANVHKN